MANTKITPHVLDSTLISGHSTVTAATNDFVLIQDVSDSNALKKALVSDLAQNEESPTFTGNVTVSGNLGVGVTPEGAYSSYSSIEFGQQGAIFANDAADDFGLKVNTYLDSGGNWKRKETGVASALDMDGDQIKFFTAASGSADANITFAQKLRIDNDGIKFGTDTAAANALDDYEEGTWTPQLSDLGGNLATLSTAEGSYTKIGRMVFLHYRVIMSSKGSMTGNYIHLKNIPFNHPTQAYNGTGMVDYFTGLESNVSSLSWDTSSTAGVFWLVGVTATQGTAVSYIPTSYLGGNEQFKGSVIYQTSV